MISDHYKIISDLTTSNLPLSTQKVLLEEFAKSFGWKPSDHFGPANDSEFAVIHLLVEHGLENTAVLSFLRHPYCYANLTLPQKTSLLSLSYNNLVDWHIPVSSSDFATVFNRIDVSQERGVVKTYQLSEENLEQLRSEMFGQITGRKPSPNLPALDDALIDTISFWKLRISAEMDNDVSIEALSALFNSIIFARAVEDHQNRLRGVSGSSVKALIGNLESGADNNTVRAVLRRTVEGFLQHGENIPGYLLRDSDLEVFDKLSPQTVSAVFSDFYLWRGIPYTYDFSVMSKHALSRIYERYVSILQIAEDPPAKQPLLPMDIKPLPKEVKRKSLGSVYTPQFIAKFFAKFLRDRMPYEDFLNARVVDPACGSGIFLRTLLEIRYEDILSETTYESVNEEFQRVFGIDLDPNATQATRLSMALLFLALTNKFPETLAVFDDEAIEYVQKNSELKGSMDAVLANPPFVSKKNQLPALRERIVEYMANFASGNIDAYLPFLLIALEILKPGGYGFFVLPRGFLLTKSAKKMREVLANQTLILCLADLSEISVFERVGAYPVLLIFQKKYEDAFFSPAATIVKCQDFVGRALQAVLDQQAIESRFYSVYRVDQDTFKDTRSWVVLPAGEASLRKKFEQLPEISDFFHIQQGFKAGSDVFILNADQVPEGEENIFVPYLRDREMRSYLLPNEISSRFFYPFLNGRPITEEELKDEYPKTWNYLNSHKEELEKRNDVIKGELAWWKPQRPRTPDKMMRPKIVSPHLVLTPRFSLDLDGEVAVASAPFLYPKEEDIEADMLRFFVAILNSRPCFWYIVNSSHVYGGGYSMLDVNTLKRTRVPNLTGTSISEKQQILELVNLRLISSGTPAIEIEKRIDTLVSEFYQLSETERQIIGMD